ncbi:MAG TPA: RNA polymerase sigma factor SigJ [Actinoplanes sp.]|jgi:RNA polymerase sigma-70 factor (ECF subfamily)
MDTGTTDVFEDHRGLLFSVAYQVLGTVVDAEDVVQDTWLRWRTADHDSVRDAKRYLIQATTRTAIDQMRRARARREAYIGPWLPEPLLTGPHAGTRLEMTESVSMAMMVVLESLSPLERVVFVLHDVFDLDYAEVADTVDRSQETVRQLAHRARAHIRERRPRYATDHFVSRQVTDRFLAACVGGDMGDLLDLLAPDVVMWADSNGSGEMPRVPLHGAADVVAFFARSLDVYPPGMAYRPVQVNGAPAAVLADGPEVLAVITLDLDEDHQVTAIRLVRNPEKLTRIEA